MSVVYNGNGSLPFPTTGAQVRRPITGCTSGSPVVVTCPGHGFNTGDTVEQESVGGNALANGVFQITVQSGNTYALNGVNGGGAYTSGGYAIDYELQPAIVLPAGAELADPGVVGAAFEGNANTAPWLYRRDGKWRLYNQYQVLAGNDIATPLYDNPWSTQSGLIPGGWAAFNSAQFTLQSLSDTPSIAPFFGANEWIEMDLSYSVYATVSSGAANPCHFACGAQINAGTGINMLTMPFEMNTVLTTTSSVYGISCSAGFPASFTASNIYLTLTYLVDYVPSGSVELQLVGILTGVVRQYRQN